VHINGFTFGLGIGIGKIRRYVEKNIFEEAVTLTKSINFMKGFGIGLGSVSANLSKDLLVEILSKTAADAYFAKNFGFGLGHNFSLIDDNKKKEILEIMRQSEDYFLAGLGEGLGHSLPLTGSRLVEEVMQTIGSVKLARGVARGVTQSFIYLNLAEVLGMLEYASFNPEYGKVLGEGLADKFAALDEEKQSWVLDSLQKESNFSKRFAKMIKKNLVYLSPQIQERIKALATKFPHLDIAIEKER
jgi:hypothetical protein